MRRIFLCSLLVALAAAWVLLQVDYRHDAIGLIRYLAGGRSGQNLTAQSRTEEQWLTDEICRDIAEMIFFAKNGPKAKASDLTLRCEWRGGHSLDVAVDVPPSHVRENLALSGHLWRQDNYVPLAHALVSQWNVAVPSAANEADTDLVDEIATGGMATLIDAAKRTSESLTRSPLDPSLHEKAAFLIGCFALHEAAGTFSDVRPALNRMTAHLAVAGLQVHEQSNCGKIANVILLSLAGRQTEAFAKISSLPASLDKWITALQIRTTGDWRVLANPVRACRLQQFEYFRALRQRGLCPKSRAFLSKIDRDQSPDWVRIALEDRLSVDEGHIFAAASVPSEVASVVADYQTFFGETLSRSLFTSALNQSETRCLTKARDGGLRLEVLSWGTLAMFHQRHLCHAAVKTEYFLQYSWGVREEAKKFRDNAEKFLGRMTMFPLARQCFTTEDRSKRSSTEQAVTFTHDHPELVTAATWAELGPIIGERGERGFPHDATAWFAEFPIVGTTYDFASRYQHFRAGRDAATLQRLAWLAPFDHDIIGADIEAEHKAVEQVATAYAALAEFDVRAMWQVAEAFKDQPQVYGKMFEPICELHPDYFLILGQYYVDKQMPAAAAVAYQNAFERAEDRVYMANSSRWIVDYYFDNGRVDDALKIATDAADVYSHTGLCTMGHLMERMKRYSEAERYYKKVHERYDDPAVLNAFYLRNRDAAVEYAQRSDQLKASAFPRGIEKAHLQDFANPPRDGVSIASNNTLVHGAHLKEGDVIVAINEVRVHSEKQYIFVRDMDQDPNMTLIVWNGAQYSERNVNVPNRRFYCKLADYKAH